MGVFGSIKQGIQNMQEEYDRKEEQKQIEKMAYDAFCDEVKKKMSISSLLNLLMESLKNEDQNSWILIANDYYESCKREVLVEPDLFLIRWNTGSHQEKEIAKYDLDGNPVFHNVEVPEYCSIAYSYTKSGYLPLTEYIGESEKDGTSYTVKLNDMVKIWANVLRERMMEEFPELQINDVLKSEKSERYIFSYSVPSQEYKKWY